MLRSAFDFHLGVDSVEYVQNYKYLGIVLNEFLDFSVTSEALSQAANRALGALNSKVQVLKNIGFESYTKLYNACVTSVLDYCSSVWGFGKHDKCDVVQNRALRFYLGVHRFTPTHAITGDTGWISCRNRRHINMVRYWNRLLAMGEERLTKRVFLWDFALNNNNWSNDLCKIFDTVNVDTENLVYIDIPMVKRMLLSILESD